MIERIKSVLLGVAALLLVFLCSLAVRPLFCYYVADIFTPRPVLPSYTDLARHGFYVFVLPEQEVVRRGWEQSIRLGSWDVHCGLLWGDTYNPLIVNYRDGDGELPFRVQLGPWQGPSWSFGSPYTEVPVESPWSSTETLLYYSETTEEGVIARYYFIDMQGYPVILGSQLPFTETLELIEQLAYVGPPLEHLTDPWDCR